MGINSRASRRKLHAASGCLRTANNAGWNDKAVQEIVRTPRTVKTREVYISICRNVSSPVRLLRSVTSLRRALPDSNSDIAA
ncbi:hypothetical protein GJ11_p02060 (plasmid) [Escherichia coli]|nr:hypothetical protein GJ11_p02060 [Escherichia coli]